MKEIIKSYLWDLYIRSHSEFLHYTRRVHRLNRKPIQRILIYHQVDKHSVNNFERQISYFVNNYKIFSLTNFIKAVNEENNLYENILCLTIDDAYKSIYEYAVPILDRYGIKPCIFVPVGFINALDKIRYIRTNLAINIKDDSMTWDELRDLVERGYEVGSHSCSHIDFSKENNIDFQYELGISKSKLQEILGIGVKYFAFPFGKSSNITNEAIDKAKEYGYSRVFSGVRCAVIDNCFLLPRTYINLNWNEKALKCVLAGYFDNRYVINF